MELSLVREDREGRPNGVSVVPPGALPSSYVRMRSEEHTEADRKSTV